MNGKLSARRFLLQASSAASTGFTVALLFLTGCASNRQSAIGNRQFEIPAALIPPGVTVGRASSQADVATTAVVAPPAPPLLLLDGSRYPLTGEGGFTNTIVSFWRTPTVCEVSNGCALSGDLRYFLSCAITIINTSATAWTGPSAAEHPEWFSEPATNCHPHRHLEDAFLAELKAASTGEVVRSEGDKGFCWRSLTRFFGTNAPLASACDAPVIQSGWGDTYDAGTLCNGIDVTGVADGYYRFRITLDPLQRYGFHQSLEQLVYLTQTNVTKVLQPTLAIQKSNDCVVVSWISGPGWVLQLSEDGQTWATQEQFSNSNAREFPANQPQQFFRLALQ